MEEKLEELVKEKEEREKKAEEEREEKKKVVEKEKAERKKEVEKEREEWRKEVEKEKEERKKEVEKEKEERKRRRETTDETGNDREQRSQDGEQRSQHGGGERSRLSVILTDSNGRDSTSDSVKNHIPLGERGDHEIKLHVAYTTEEAFRRVGDGGIDVRNATVIIDNLTNDVRGTRLRPALSPQELVQRVDILRERLRAAGATAAVVCEVKPMEVVDVTPYNKALDDYLRSRGIYGCATQVRRSFLQRDGFHIRPQYDAVLDRSYACAVRGVPVPSPTPTSDFVPEFVKRRRNQEWPTLSASDSGWGQRGGGEAPVIVHGWSW